MGKLLACLTLVTGLLLMLILSALGLLLAGLPSVSIGRYLPSFGWYAVGLVLFSFTLTVIGVSVSLLTRSSALSLVVLSGFWLLGVF